MKSIVVPQPMVLDEKTKKELTTEVKETLAVTPKTSKKTFTADEMWNRQRQSRSASAMMRRWNLN